VFRPLTSIHIRGQQRGLELGEAVNDGAGTELRRLQLRRSGSASSGVQSS
jgi:hypothetical protein